MKISEEQFQKYLEVIPPVIWTWIYGELEEGKAKLAVRGFLFDETDHMRDLTPHWKRTEFNDLVSKFPEVKTATMRAASDFYIRHSWRKWLPWNCGK